MAPRPHRFAVVSSLIVACALVAAPLGHAVYVRAAADEGPTSGEPTPLPITRVALATRSHEGLAYFLAHGLRVGLACPSACTATSTLQLERRAARRIGIAAAAVSLGKATARMFDAGELVYPVKAGSMSQRALRTTSRIVLTLRTTVASSSGTTTSTRHVVITRKAPVNHKPEFAAGRRSTASTDLAYDQAGSLIDGVTTITLTDPAHDADGDPIAYSWSVSNGANTAVGRRVAWMRPVDAGALTAGTATLTVSDGRGGTASAKFAFVRGAG